jgi:hypothetical protein
MASRGVQLKFGTMVVLVMTMPRMAGFAAAPGRLGAGAFCVPY